MHQNSFDKRRQRASFQIASRRPEGPSPRRRAAVAARPGALERLEREPAFFPGAPPPPGDPGLQAGLLEAFCLRLPEMCAARRSLLSHDNQDRLGSSAGAGRRFPLNSRRILRPAGARRIHGILAGAPGEQFKRFMDAFKELERRLRCSDCGERAVSVEPIFHPDWRG